MAKKQSYSEQFAVMNIEQLQEMKTSAEKELQQAREVIARLEPKLYWIGQSMAEKIIEFIDELNGIYTEGELAKMVDYVRGNREAVLCLDTPIEKTVEAIAYRTLGYANLS